LLCGLRELYPSHALLLLGVAPEAAMNDEILDLAGIGDARNLAREMSVPRLMALSEGALGMISVDTGPAHVAAALSCHVLALFDSPGKQAMYAPRGPGHSARCIVGGTDAAPSLLGITAEEVLKAWQELDVAQARKQLRGDAATGVGGPITGLAS
jgi:heptosyltransferase-2/heptosyltransferase-3